MRYLFAATCLTPVALLASQAEAQTVISGASTTPINTSTANGGSPSDVQISSTGSLKPATGPAVTVDSNNNVDNEGAIQITDVDNTAGIQIQAGRSSNITNGGTITIDETFTAADTNGDGIADPPYASGTGRYGIHALGAMTGTITSSGAITVKGNNSAGIALDGPLTGSLSSTSAITVTGNNDFGIHTGDVSGAVSIGTGTISLVGQNAVGVALDGNIGGQVTFQGSVSSTGFATLTPGETNTADLLVGGPAVRIQGNVAGGLLFTALPATSTTNTDVNNDGVLDAGEGTASIASYGSAPAVQIGSSTNPITIGALSAGAANGSGILNEGTISGSGLDAGFSATGMQIGGLGGTVTIAGGLNNAGTIEATSVDSNATALHIGSGATLGSIVNSGIITATSAPTASTATVQAISIDAGSGVSSITNSGSIGAQTTGTGGTVTAIADRSGGLTMVQNQGAILTSTTTGPTGIAIDLSANTTGATVKQLASTGSNPSQIVGDIRFGGGSNLLDIESGTFAGNTTFGVGNNQVTLSGTAQQTGNIDFGGGTGSLTLGGTASLQGALANAGKIGVTINGGNLDLTNNGAVSISSLNVGAQGAFTVNVNGTTGAHTLYDVTGQASFATGAKINLKLTSVGGNSGSFVIVHAGSLSGADQLTEAGAVVPFLFNSSLSVDQADNEILLNLSPKTAAQLGLNRSESTMFNAALQAIDSDSAVAGVFLDAQNVGTLQSAFRQLLPDHAGAVFQSVAQGSRAEMRALEDPLTPLLDMGGWGIMFQQVAWGENKGMGDTDSYRTIGWGLGIGPEFKMGSFGSVGVTFSYLSGTEKDGNIDDQISSNEYELAAYWRAHWKGLRAFARVSGGYLTFDSDRFFLENDGTTTVSRTAKGSWNGTAMTGVAGLSYEVHSGSFSFRPAVSIDYVRLKENSYAETGGGAAFDLNLDSRTSHEEGVNGTVTLGYDIARAKTSDATQVRVELEGGRRELIGSSMGATTAHFAGGADFTLLPDSRDSGWLGRFRLLAGTQDFQAGGEIGSEEQQGHQAVSVRANVLVRF